MKLKTQLKKIPDEELVRRAKEDPEALEVLFQRYQRLIGYYLRYFFPRRKADQPDYFQEGRIRLFEAILNWQPNGDASFPTFVHCCIRRGLIALMAKQLTSQGKFQRRILFDSELPELKGPLEETVASSSENPEEIVLATFSEQARWEALRELLSKLEWQALRLWSEDYTYEEIAKALGVPPKTIDNALTRAKRKLRDLLTPQWFFS